jgi:hypothetical protein
MTKAISDGRLCYMTEIFLGEFFIIVINAA